MTATPYVGFGNDQLEGRPEIHDGDLIFCPHCFGQHQVTRNWPTDGSKDTSLDTYQCGGQTYMCGLNGKLLMGIEAACSGHVDLDQL